MCKDNLLWQNNAIACLNKLLCCEPEQMGKKLGAHGSLQMVVIGIHILPG